MSETTSDRDGFNPRDHIRQIRGKGGTADYLDVKHRIAWFRSEWPDGTIETQHIEITDQRAIFRAEARKVKAGGEVFGTATGYGSETPGDFGDFIEKAETKAIGRALAALGFGTQHIPDDGERIVDAAVETSAVTSAERRPPPQPPRPAPPAPRQPTPLTQAVNPANAPTVPIDAQAVTENQLRFIGDLTRACHLTDELVDAAVRQAFAPAQRPSGLTRKQASELIDRMQKKREEIEAERAKEATPPPGLPPVETTGGDVGHDAAFAAAVGEPMLAGMPEPEPDDDQYGR